MVVTVEQFCALNWALSWVNCMVCELYLTKALKKMAQSMMKHKMPSDGGLHETDMEGPSVTSQGARFPEMKPEIRLAAEAGTAPFSPSRPGIQRWLREDLDFLGGERGFQTIEWAPKGQGMLAGVQ